MKSKASPTQDKAQRQRFIDAAREAGASEDEAVFDESLKRIAKQTVTQPKRKGPQTR